MRLLAGSAAVVLFALAPLASAAPTDRAARCVADSYRGQEERDRGALVAARASFRACALDECPAIVRKDCGQWLADVEVNLPTVVLGAKDARGGDLIGVRILVDGQSHDEEVKSGRAVALDPGQHVFRFEHPPDAPIEMRAVLHTGEHNRPIFATFAPPPAAPALAPPPPPPAPAMVEVKRISGWAYVLGAAGLVGVGAFAYLGGTGLDEKNQLRATCGSTCTDAQVGPLKARYIGADVSLGVGVLVSIASAWLFLHPSVERVPASSASLTLGASAHGATVGVAGSF